MKARVLALYLPQFHPIPENDEWWGKGFTEWTNVGKARKLFCGHYQPRVPADLGYYDLRVPETRAAQAAMARECGVEGFLYWHYWFGNGKRLLERPFNEVVSSGAPDFPFALAWANETWKGLAHGLKNRNVLIEQTYPGDEDYVKHFMAILPALKDPRYIAVNGKPLFMIYKPDQMPDVSHFIELWQRLARENGLSGIYFVAHHQERRNHEGEHEQVTMQRWLDAGFDAVNFVRLTSFLEQRNVVDKMWGRFKVKVLGQPRAYRYEKFIPFFSNELDRHARAIPSLVPGWDHTPRSNKEGLVMTESSPKLFERHAADVMGKVADKPLEERLVFIKSWNEWAEGNYMEPDLKWGHGFLDALKRVLQ